MPIYEYACGSCGKLNEIIQKVNDPAPETCDGCKAPGTLSKIVSRTSFTLKGGGWYSDLYSSSSGGKKGGSGSGGASGSGSGGNTGSSSSTPPASSSGTSGASAA